MEEIIRIRYRSVVGKDHRYVSYLSIEVDIEFLEECPEIIEDEILESYQEYVHSISEYIKPSLWDNGPRRIMIRSCLVSKTEYGGTRETFFRLGSILASGSQNANDIAKTTIRLMLKDAISKKFDLFLRLQ